jgi:ATP-dependent Clp protease protease subunit
LKIKNRLNKILSENSGKPFDTVEKDTDRDNYLSAEEAKEYGLIDEIFVKRP